MNNLYDDLGVPPNASLEEVKRAYRKGAQKAHPDKEGGDAQRFHAIQRAYDVLGDETKRRRYDASGETGAPPDPQALAIQTLAQVLGQVLEQVGDVEHTDIVRVMKEQFTAQIEVFHKQVRGTEKAKAKLERALKRFTRKVEGENLMARFIEGRIKQCSFDIENVRMQIALGEQCLGMLGEYQYEVDERPKPSVPQWQSGQTMDNIIEQFYEATQQKGPGGPKFYNTRPED